MKKKTLYLSTLILLILSTTGCIKFNATMKVHKDKSFDFSIITAIDKTYFGEQEVFNEEKKKEIREKGFNVTDYQDENMVGININRKIKNIDLVSSTKDTKFNLSEILESKSNNTSIFKVKKGFLKNRYIANIILENSSNTNNPQNEKDEGINFGDIMNKEDNNTADIDPNFFQSTVTNMDLSINVILPYSAKKHNASKTNNNAKELSWTLTSNSQEPIQFEFELYNRRNIYITIAIIIIAIMIIINSNKKSTIKSKTIPEEKNIIDPIIPNSQQKIDNEQVEDIQIENESQTSPQKEKQKEPTAIQQMYQTSLQQIVPQESNEHSNNQHETNS